MAGEKLKVRFRQVMDDPHETKRDARAIGAQIAHKYKIKLFMNYEIKVGGSTIK